MSIQIIDGFQVNTALPIDNRIVASGSAARNVIPFKYEGLRVFDTSDGIPYVYLNNNWVSENASGILGSGSASRIPLYTLSNVVNNSWFYQSGFNISTVDAGTGTDKISMNARTGLLTAVSLSGNGSLVTNISGSNINNGSIEANGSNSKLINGSTGQVLLSGTSFTSWTNQSQLSVGTASNSTNSTKNESKKEEPTKSKLFFIKNKKSVNIASTKELPASPIPSDKNESRIEIMQSKKETDLELEKISKISNDN